jgi:hypothetical protein
MGEGSKDPDWFKKRVKGWIDERFQELGYAPGGQAPAQAAPSVDYSQIQEMIKSEIIQAELRMQNELQSILPKILPKILPQYLKEHSGAAAELKEAVEEYKGKVEGLARAVEIQGVASSSATQYANQALENVKALERSLAEKGYASKEDVDALRADVQGARKAFEELKPKYDNMAASDKAKDVSYKELETAYQEAQSALEGLESRVQKLEGLEEGIVKTVQDKVNKLISGRTVVSALSEELSPEMKMAIGIHIDAYMGAQLKPAIKAGIKSIFEKEYGIKPLALRKLIRLAQEKGLLALVQETDQTEAEPADRSCRSSPAEQPKQPEHKGTPSTDSPYLSRLLAPGEKPKKPDS